jgi:hypothetical protein
MPNQSDIFWWEFKATTYTVTISSLSHWSEFFDKSNYDRLVVSLDDCHFLVDETVRNMFHNTAILDRGSWARMNATLRKLFHSSMTAGESLPMAVKLGGPSSFQSAVSSFMT